MTDAATAAWEALLDRFEHDLDQAAGELAPWDPPADPLPAALVDRAESVLHRQHERLRRAGEERDGIRQQLTALRQVPQTGPSTPVYLDIQA